eukprot:Tbor_TRINITY_DN5981_c1_g1::TRINITY_DN5981_c1_g1_i1::g.19170::m.19170
MTANEEGVNLLLSKIMTDRYCSGEASDFEACIQHMVPQQVDNSYVDQALQRKGLRVCEPYRDVLQKCMQDDSKHQIILKAATKATGCQSERKALSICQRGNNNNKDCSKEATEMIFCGLVNIVKKGRGESGSS